MNKPVAAQIWMSVLFSGLVLMLTPREADTNVNAELEIAPPNSHLGSTVPVTDIGSIVASERSERDFLLNSLGMSLQAYEQLEKSRRLTIATLKKIDSQAKALGDQLPHEKQRALLEHRERMQRLLGTENFARLLDLTIKKLIGPAGNSGQVA